MCLPWLHSVFCLPVYDGCLESIQPFKISRKPVVRPWCNFAASHRRPYCASVNSHCPVGLVSRQWDAVDWACVLCDRRIHNDRASRSASSWQCACPFYSSRAGFFAKTSHHPGLSAPIQPRFASLRLLAFPKAKIVFEREEICECDGHTVHKFSQERLAANWLAPRQSDCWRMCSKASSDWLSSYIKVTRPILDIFKMVAYFPDSPRSFSNSHRSWRCMLSDGLSVYSDSATDWIAKSGDKFQSKAQDFSFIRSSSKPAVRTIQFPFQLVSVFFRPKKRRRLGADHYLSVTASAKRDGAATCGPLTLL
jgi:hypothetical protein